MRPALGAALACALSSAAFAQPTAFTYQGSLKENGSPAGGTYDFRFKLFAASSGGTQVGATQCVDNLQVDAGHFTASLDFGNQFATAAQRFIEIEVRRDTGLGCADTGGFVVLAPRQSISPAPAATHANSAFALDAPDGSPANAVFVDNAGKVGIGTTSPTHALHIAHPEPTLALQDTDSSGLSGGQQVGYLSYRDDANVERGWIGYGSPGDPDLSIVNARPAGDIILLPFNGRVGIGTAVPAATLEVRGDIRMGQLGQYFATSGDEDLRVLRGIVATTGAPFSGSGWSSSRFGIGRYNITYNRPFSDVPIVVATAGSFNPISVTVVNDNAAGCQLVARDAGGTLTDISVRFIIAGAR